MHASPKSLFVWPPDTLMAGPQQAEAFPAISVSGGLGERLWSAGSSQPIGRTLFALGLGNSLMMPVPSHLIECVVPNDSVIDEEDLYAVVQCPCGSTRFHLLFPGQTHEYDGEVVPCTARIEENYFFLLKAACTNCEKEHLLLDEDFHGWNGFVCHNPQKAALPRPALQAWKCLNCSETVHEATIFIQTEGRDDFVSESSGKFEADLWPEAFGCFNMGIRCSGCGKDTLQWVSCETM